MFSTYIELYRNPVKMVEIVEIWLQKDLPKYRLVLLFIFNFMFIGMFLMLQAVELFKIKNIGELSEILGVLPLFTGVCIKGLNILYRKNQILSSLKLLKEMTKPESCSESKMEKRINQISKFYKMLYCATIFSSLFGFLEPILYNGLFYKMWFLFDYKNNLLMQWSLVIYQLINFYIYILPLSVFDFFPLFLISYAVGLIEDLSNKLEAITIKTQKKVQGKSGNLSVSDMNDDLEELKKCIKTQLKIKEFVSTINDNFGKIFWLQGLISTLILCTTSFSMTTVS